MNVVYPESDISRAILSGCLNNGVLNQEAVATFVSGYREYQALSQEISPLLNLVEGSRLG